MNPPFSPIRPGVAPVEWNIDPFAHPSDHVRFQVYGDSFEGYTVTCLVFVGLHNRVTCYTAQREIGFNDLAMSAQYIHKVQRSLVRKIRRQATQDAVNIDGPHPAQHHVCLACDGWLAGHHVPTIGPDGGIVPWAPTYPKRTRRKGVFCNPFATVQV